MSCAAIDAGTAVGVSDNGPLAEAWDGTHWSIQSTPNPSGSSQLYGDVSCPAPAACTAVGYTYNGSIGGLTEHWDCTTWTAQTVASGALFGISCATSATCTAVGGGPAGSGAYAEAWDGTSWTSQITPSPAGTSRFFGVSCSSSVSCIAVGVTDTNGTELPLIDQYS